MTKYTIKYQYGTYSGTVEVWADGPDEAIEKMWADFRQRGLLTLSMAYKSAEIISEE